MPAALPPPPTKPAPREARAWLDFDHLAQPRAVERQTIGSAVLLTLFLHCALFFWVLPWIGNAMKSAPAIVVAPAADAPAPAIEYVLTPLTPEDKRAVRFIETNPAAPTSAPAPTVNISNRDQSAAQPVPDPNGHSDLPATTGEKANSEKIVSGDSNKPAPTPSPPAAQPRPPATAPPAAPQPVAYSQPVSLPGKAISSDGEGVQISDQPSEAPANKTADKVSPTVADAQKNYVLPPGPLTPETVAASAAAATPQPRPALNPSTHAGPVMKNSQATHKLGLPAADAKFTPFGAYLAQMGEAIETEWDIECGQYQFGVQDSGTAAAISFVVNSQGEVEKVTVENSTATRGATLMCVSAIKHPAPFGVWTKEMTAMLGERQTITFTFYYE